MWRRGSLGTVSIGRVCGMVVLEIPGVVLMYSEHEHGSWNIAIPRESGEGRSVHAAVHT